MVSVAAVPEASPAVALAPDELSPLLWRDWISWARCSTSAARAGSVLSEMPLSELCAKLALAKPSVAIKAASLSFFIVISIDQ